MSYYINNIDRHINFKRPRPYSPVNNLNNYDGSRESLRNKFRYLVIIRLWEKLQKYRLLYYLLSKIAIVEHTDMQ